MLIVLSSLRYAENGNSWRRAYVTWLKGYMAQISLNPVHDGKKAPEPLQKRSKVALIGPEREGKSWLVQRIAHRDVPKSQLYEVRVPSVVAPPELCTMIFWW